MPAPRRLFESLRLIVTGFAMGSADLVPGVSGGTMALVFGVYEQLLTAITSVNRTAIRLLGQDRFRDLARHVPLGFVLPLGFGIVGAIILLSEPLGRMLDDPQGRPLLFAFFFGLVAASVVAIGRRIPWQRTTVAAAVAGTAFGYLAVTATPAQGSRTAAAIFLSGAIAICAMILPGISGSFILLILGQYDHVLDAVRSRDILTIVVFGSGAVLGLLLFARLLRRLLARHRNPTLATLVGFMLGSLWKIWPWRACASSFTDTDGTVRCLADSVLLPSWSMTVLFAIALSALGGLLVTAVDRVESGRPAGDSLPSP